MSKFKAMIEGFSKEDLMALRARINIALAKGVPRPSMIGNKHALGKHRMKTVVNGVVK